MYQCLANDKLSILTFNIPLYKCIYILDGPKFHYRRNCGFSRKSKTIKSAISPRKCVNLHKTQ